MKKKSMKLDVVKLAKSDLQQTRGGTRDNADLQEVTQTGKKKTNQLTRG